MSADGRERIARRLARAGVASRRGSEAIIAAGRVAVNGRVIDSPALDVGPDDRVTLDGRPLAAPEPPRLWRYHKPAGLVTTAADEKGRPTVFASLPAEMPRVNPVGRLDMTSEGLLLLTNDGALKRLLELPSTGWLRRYRVRARGAPDDAALAPLRRGITIEGERFQPMEVAVDRQQGANVWLTVALREGRNREIRRAMEAVGLVVNRLIRVSYGPFQLGDLRRGAVEEVRPKILRDQLGPRVSAELGLAPKARAEGAPKARAEGAPKARAEGAPKAQRGRGCAEGAGRGCAEGAGRGRAEGAGSPRKGGTRRPRAGREAGGLHRAPGRRRRAGPVRPHHRAAGPPGQRRFPPRGFGGSGPAGGQARRGPPARGAPKKPRR